VKCPYKGKEEDASVWWFSMRHGHGILLDYNLKIKEKKKNFCYFTSFGLLYRNDSSWQPANPVAMQMRNAKGQQQNFEE
jgi:hypothetical protein